MRASRRGDQRARRSRAEMFATATSAGGQRLAQRVGEPEPRPRRRSRRVPRRRLDARPGRGRPRGPARSRASPPRSRARPSRSRRRAGSRARAVGSSSRQSRVVACAPVPNARPGSITTALDARRAASPTAARPRAARRAPAGGSRASAPPSRPPRRRRAPRRTRAQSRSSPASSVYAASSSAVGVLELLEALREELEHQRARRLGALDRHGRGDAAERAQRNALFSFSKNPSSAS